MLDFDRYLEVLRAAAEPTRLRLLVLCAGNELTVTELTHILGQSQPRVSRHLRLMVEAGLLERFREGTWAFYRLARGSDAGAVAWALAKRVPSDDPMLLQDGRRLTAIKEERAAAAAEYFRKNAARWDEIRKLHADDNAVEKALVGLLGDKPVESFLDIGTGTGRMLSLFGRKVGRGVGIDTSREMLAVARENLEREGLRNCQVRLGDMYSISVDGSPFDLITIHLVLHYADQPLRVISEAARLLMPGGRLVIVDFAPHDLEHLRDDHAHRRLGFSDTEIEGWCRASGLAPQPAVALPGNSLMVKIWVAELRQRPEIAAFAGKGQDQHA